MNDWKNIVERLEQLEERLNIEGCDQIKKHDLTFAEALKLLQDGYADKISCWSFNIFVYFNRLLINPLEEEYQSYLCCKTLKGHHVIWNPNQFELLEAKWRIVE